MQKVVFVLFFILFSLFLTPSHIGLLSAQPLSIGEQKVIYDLPHPGMLPDNPLYIFKQLRDTFFEFTTRDNLKKADIYLTFSDKHMAMAQELAAKGKDQLSVKTLKKGEEYFLKIPSLLIASKKQGAAPSEDFVQKLHQSNVKHREVMEEILKDLPQGQAEELAQVIELNDEASQKLREIK
jgi:hypothetical protein